MFVHLNVPEVAAGSAVGGGEDPPAADEGAPAPHVAGVTSGHEASLPGILIDLGVLASNNPRRSLSQSTVARILYKWMKYSTILNVNANRMAFQCQEIVA